MSEAVFRYPVSQVTGSYPQILCNNQIIPAEDCLSWLKKNLKDLDAPLTSYQKAKARLVTRLVEVRQIMDCTCFSDERFVFVD